jgi:hypothetical protein
MIKLKIIGSWIFMAKKKIVMTDGKRNIIASLLRKQKCLTELRKR